MKVLINALRIIVGTLFLLAGIVKLNDPIGFALLLQSYFGEASLHLEFVYDRALIFAVLIILLEITFGVMLMLGYAFQLAKWILVFTAGGLTVFTLSIAYANTLEDCGYLTSTTLLRPEASFWKFLGIFIVSIILFIKSRIVHSSYKLMVNKWIVFVTFILTLFINYQVLTHLPLFDFSPFQKGTSLSKAIEAPEDFESSPWDFRIFNKQEDLTSSILAEEKLILIVCTDLQHTDIEGWKKIKPWLEKVRKKKYKIWVLTPSSTEKIDDFKTDWKLEVNFAQIDRTHAENMIRANPGILVLDQGVILQKKHGNSVNRIKLE